MNPRPTARMSFSADCRGRLNVVAFTARLNSNPIDEDLSMGTPVKSCPDTKLEFFNTFLIPQLQVLLILGNLRLSGPEGPANAPSFRGLKPSAPSGLLDLQL